MVIRHVEVADRGGLYRHRLQVFVMGEVHAVRSFINAEVSQLGQVFEVEAVAAAEIVHITK